MSSSNLKDVVGRPVAEQANVEDVNSEVNFQINNLHLDSDMETESLQTHVATDGAGKDAKVEQSNDGQMEVEEEEQGSQAKGSEQQGNSKSKQNDKERKAVSGYKSSRQYIKKMQAKDPNTLTDRDKALVKKHEAAIRKYESRHPHAASNLQTSSGSAGKPSTSSKPGTSGEQKKPQASAGSSSLPLKPKQNDVTGTSAGKALKRGRSDQEIKRTNALKKTKLSDSFLASRKELQVAVIDRSHLDGAISIDNWLLVEGEILKAMITKHENGGSSEDCNFEGAGWFKGVKIVECGCDRALCFLKETISAMGELWTGAQLEVIPKDSLPLRRCIRVWIPPPNVLVGDKTLEMLQLRNPEIDMKDWRLNYEKKCEGSNGWDVKITIDKASEQSIKEKSGILKFGLGRVNVKFDGQDEEKSKVAGGTD